MSNLLFDHSKSGLIFTFLICVPHLLFAQTNPEDIVIGKVGDQEITYDELKQNFTSGDGNAPTLSELEEFLPVYLNYRAKLLAAKEEGYFEDPELIAEHKQYAKQAAYSFWLQNEIKAAAFEKFKERSEIELNTFHILISVQDDDRYNSGDEAIEALKKAKHEIQSGTPLEEVDRKYSTVRGSRSMGGDLPWVSAGRTVMKFEDTAYNLEVGEVSDPVKTQFGYHIIYLQDKRERVPSRLVRHIYTRTTNDSSAYNKIQQAYNRLQEGSEWTSIVSEFSEDTPSASNGGRIGWINYQENLNQDFLDAAMQVDPELPYSEPIKTNYGYHIFRVDTVETFNSEAQRDEALMEQLSNTPYYSESNDFVIEYIKEEIAYNENIGVLDDYEKWLEEFDNTPIGELPAPKSDKNALLLSFDQNDFTLLDFHTYIKENYAERTTGLYDRTWFKRFSDDIIGDHIIDITAERYPEFEAQSESYLNGLVVYNINDDKIWSAATVDTTRLRQIYEQNLENYSYPERPSFYLITARQDSTLQKAIDFIHEGGNPDSLRSNIDRIGVSKDSTSRINEEPYNLLNTTQPQSFSKKFDYRNGRAVFWMEEILPARNMSFEEAFNRILAEFQPQREDEWLNELREAYNTTSYPEKLEEAYRKSS